MFKNFLVRQILKIGGSFFVGASIAIGTLCPIVLTSPRALADSRESPNIPTDAKSELTTLFWQGINAKTIAFTPNGGWIILYNKNDASWNTNLPIAAANKILALNKQGSTINTIAFTPSGEWVIVYNKNNAYWSGNLAQDVKNALVTLNKQGSTINTIAFTPSGEWVIIFDGNGDYRSDNFPQAPLAEINTLNKQKSTINSVAFEPGGGWAILYDNNGCAYMSISQAAADTIVENHNIGNTFINIAFTPSYGFVLLFSPSLAQEQQYLIEQEAYQSLGY